MNVTQSQTTLLKRSNVNKRPIKTTALEGQFRCETTNLRAQITNTITILDFFFNYKNQKETSF